MLHTLIAIVAIIFTAGVTASFLIHHKQLTPVAYQPRHSGKGRGRRIPTARHRASRFNVVWQYSFSSL